MENLPNLLAKLFITRPDRKMVQARNGNWLRDDLPWTRAEIEKHLSGEATYGNFLVSEKGQSKFVTIRINLAEEGSYLWPDDPESWDQMNNFTGEVREFNPLQAWFDRAHPGRAYLKLQFKTLAVRLCHEIRKQLDVPYTALYNGDGGIDVFGFTGVIPATEAVAGAELVIDSLGNWQEQWEPSEPNLHLDILSNAYQEVFLPLPLGKNPDRPSEPIFFVDLAGPLDVLAPVDPVWALTTDNPFKKPGE